MSHVPHCQHVPFYRSGRLDSVTCHILIGLWLQSFLHQHPPERARANRLLPRGSCGPQLASATRA